MSERVQTKPLILITNDDGIQSPGLQAAARAAVDLADILVVAPDRQWSGAGRSLPPYLEGEISPYPFQVADREFPAFQVDGSPAAGVLHGLREPAPRKTHIQNPGIISAENVGAGRR